MNGTARNKFLAIAVFSLVGSASLSGVDLSPDYRKIEPVALATDDPAIVAAQRKSMGAPGRTELSVPVFIHLNGDDPNLPERLNNLGGTGRRIHSRLYAGQIPRDAARYISNWSQVAYIEGVKLARPLLDLSRPAVSANTVQAGTGLPSPFDIGITGAGMYVGIVDTGLDNTHLDFHTNGSGSPLRVAHTYSNRAELISQGYSPDPLVDEDGHGTHVAGIAAGNGYSSAGSYTGMAPGAEVLFGKTSFTTSDVLLAVQDLIAFAEAASKPVAVNLSLGLMLGPHDNTSAFESGINSLAEGAAGSKRLIAVAAGNEKTLREHSQATLSPFGTTSMFVTFNLATPSATLYVWADGNDEFRVSATMGTEVVTVPSGSSASSPGGRISLSNKVAAPPNGATLISVFFTPFSGGGTATIQLTRTRNGGTGKIDAYIDSTDGSFGSPTVSGTIIEPANGPAVIAVGSFNTKNSNGLSSTQDISYFSSLGPTRDGRLKPDITAPGSIIYSARSIDAPSTNFNGIVTVNDKYAILSGTSMATPHITGIAALAWESNPNLSGAQMRERIRRTANAPTDGSTPPNTTWGYGKTNALKAVSDSVASITAPATTVPGSAVSLSSGKSSGAFGNPLSYAWSLSQRPAGSVASLSSAASSTTFTPDVPGNYTIALSVSQSVPSGTPSGSASSTLHVNNVPVASVSGPASGDVSAPVSFSGLGSTDADLQTLTYRWVMVSRPSGSSASLSTSDIDNVTLTTDAQGTYEVGLRVDDGLDNSALAIHSFTAASGSSQSTSGGGGGGCSMANHDPDAGNLTAIFTVILLLSPAGIVAARRKAHAMRRVRRSRRRRGAQ